MFILSFHNLKANHEVDDAIDQHRAFVEKHMASGVFLVGGAKVPRTGGIIVAQGVSRAEIDAIAASAPFAQRGLATIEVTEFKAIFVAAGLNLSYKELSDIA